MLLPSILLTAVLPLHVLVGRDTLEVRSGSAVLARVLCTSVRGIDEARMTDAQRQARDDVLRQIDSTWAKETWKGQLRLGLALAKAEEVEPQAQESQAGCRFLFPEGQVVRVDVFLSNPTGSSAVVVEDLESGQYLALEKVGRPSDLPELFQKLILPIFDRDRPAKKDEAADEELRRRIREESERVGTRTRVVAEVNGQRDLLPEGARDDEIGASLARMWDNLDGEARRRIERVLGFLAIVRAVMEHPTAEDAALARADLPASALRFKGVPAIEAPSGTRVVRTSTFKDGALALQAPPDEVTKPFYGERGWWAVEFSGSFPSQVERLLRGDRH